MLSFFFCNLENLDSHMTLWPFSLTSAAGLFSVSTVAHIPLTFNLLILWGHDNVQGKPAL